MATMLGVLSTSSGQNAAITEEFPSQVLTSRYAAGFSNSLMLKDLQLYMRTAGAQGGPTSIGEATASVGERFASKEPGVDFTRMYPYVVRS